MDDLVYRGIIIRQANYGDAHRMLWIFTETDGIIKAVRYGIRGKKTSNAAAFQLFSYADFNALNASWSALSSSTLLAVGFGSSPGICAKYFSISRRSRCYA